MGAPLQKVNGFVISYQDRKDQKAGFHLTKFWHADFGDKNPRFRRLLNRHGVDDSSWHSFNAQNFPSIPVGFRLRKVTLAWGFVPCLLHKNTCQKQCHDGSDKPSRRQADTCHQNLNRVSDGQDSIETK